MRIQEFIRVSSKISINVDGCWNWTGHTNQKGYAMFKAKDKLRTVHRWIYFYIRGENPDGNKLTIDHLCRNRKCVNPYHLELVTGYENYKRGLGPYVHSRKTMCPSGHQYDEENTRIKVDKKTGTKRRICKECERVYMRRKRHAEIDKRIF